MDLEPRQGDSWGGNQEEDRQGPGLHGTYVLSSGSFQLGTAGIQAQARQAHGHLILPWF